MATGRAANVGPPYRPPQDTHSSSPVLKFDIGISKLGICIVKLGFGMVWLVWHDMAGYGLVWLGMAWYGLGMAWYGWVWHGMVGYGIVRLSMVM
jgi:hypothetical protein